MKIIKFLILLLLNLCTIFIGVYLMTKNSEAVGLISILIGCYMLDKTITHKDTL